MSFAKGHKKQFYSPTYVQQGGGFGDEEDDEDDDDEDGEEEEEVDEFEEEDDEDEEEVCTHVGRHIRNIASLFWIMLSQSLPVMLVYEWIL